MPQFRQFFASVAGFVLAMCGCAGDQSAFPLDLPELDPQADRALFFPILRNYQRDDVFSRTVVHLPISDDLAVYACRRIERPNGATGIDYVMKRNFEEYGLSEAELFELCFKNFFAGKIQVNVMEQDGSKLFELTRADGLVAALIGHESTYDEFSEMVGAAELTVLIHSPDAIVVTARGSDFEVGFPKIVEEQLTQSEVIDLSPGILHWNADRTLVRVQP